ncbi:MAG: hypothetical protein LBT20_06495 [Clostridiales bacterium]|jgi:ABC-type bacteriocin/lantibiotic exporter with double-glycine peptidase domain|nr:hypothetical protein [Clostridiales bacterium]
MILFFATSILVLLFAVSGFIYLLKIKFKDAKNGSYVKNVFKKAVPFLICALLIMCISAILLAIYVSFYSVGYVLFGGVIAFTIIWLVISAIESNKIKKKADELIKKNEKQD